jgi:hypothetical protein
MLKRLMTIVISPKSYGIKTNFGNPTKIQKHTVSVGTSREDPSETSRATTEADLDVFPMSVHDFNLARPEFES